MEAERERETPDELVGANIRALRELKGMSQAEMARRMTALGWPWHQSTVYRIEQGRQPIGLLEAKALAELLETSVDRFTWEPAEAEDAEFVYAIGKRLKDRYYTAGEAVYLFLFARTEAERVVEQYAGSEYERVHEALRDVAERLEQNTLDAVIGEGMWLWRGELAEAREEERHRGEVTGSAQTETPGASAGAATAAAAQASRQIPVPVVLPDQFLAGVRALRESGQFDALARAASGLLSPEAQQSMTALASALQDKMAQTGALPVPQTPDELAAVAAVLGAASALKAREESGT